MKPEYYYFIPKVSTRPYEYKLRHILVRPYVTYDLKTSSSDYHLYLEHIWFNITEKRQVPQTQHMLHTTLRGCSCLPFPLYNSTYPEGPMIAAYQFSKGSVSNILYLSLSARGASPKINSTNLIYQCYVEKCMTLYGIEKTATLRTWPVLYHVQLERFHEPTE